MFDVQDSLSNKRLEDFATMAEGDEHQKAKEQMNTQEWLNTMVASHPTEGGFESHGATIPEYEEWSRRRQD